LPDRDSPRQLQGCRSVTDEIVVYDEYLVCPAQATQDFEFLDQLRGSLRSRLAAVDGDDVAELALERAAARELHRHRKVFLPAQ
jgi:hypothetical protein